MKKLDIIVPPICVFLAILAAVIASDKGITNPYFYLVLGVSLIFIFVVWYL